MKLKKKEKICIRLRFFTNDFSKFISHLGTGIMDILAERFYKRNFTYMLDKIKTSWRLTIDRSILKTLGSPQ
jgi:hypothetical protein